MHLVRITKDPEERKAEILDTAERLFATKGYAQTTILDILNEIGIAKGTFYYYFKSKEEVMNSIISRIVDERVVIAKKIANDPKLPAIQKMLNIIVSMCITNDEENVKLIEQAYHLRNAEMRECNLIQVMIQVPPILTQVVEQGIREHTMATDYPLEAVELLVAATQVVFDSDLFYWEEDEIIKKVKAFINMMETSLGVEKGSFNDMMNILM